MATDVDRRTQLAVAAYEVVAESGIDGLSLRTVARRVGATTGLVSHHFHDRKELVAAALDHAVATMMQRSLAVAPDASPFDVLAAVLPTDPVTMQVWRFSLSVRAAGLFDAELRPFDEMIRDHWARNLPARLDAAVVGDPVEAARHLVALVDGISLNAALDPEGWPADRQVLHLRAGMRVLDDGALAPRGRPSRRAAGKARNPHATPR